jgi:heptosyltransferase-2
MEFKISSKPWTQSHPPKRILVMRFQALGDTIITLPYLQNLKRQYPQLELHFLTRSEVSLIPQSVALFDKVIVIGGGRNLKLQLLIVLLKLPWLWWKGYEAVIDLQNHKLSRLIRKVLFVRAWSEFDKTSPVSAGDRTKNTIEALWPWKILPDHDFTAKKLSNRDELLVNGGWIKGHDLIILNPAGYCASRNWPVENYITFANLWLKTVNPMTQFVLLLLPSHHERADFIKKALGKYCIDLTGQANQLQAFLIIKRSALVLSEDSGLMHMAWVQAVPTIALFSSSRKDWSGPQGERSYCFDSSDLECGPCMKEVCQYGDNRCLTRYTPQVVLQKAITLHGKK